VANPELKTTEGIKLGANYSKLVNGIVPAGIMVEKGDVLISVRK